MPENEEAAPADAAPAIGAKAEATSTATASDELSEDDLDAVAGGILGRTVGSTPSDLDFNFNPKYSLE
jgi:hypothetical protein